MAKNKHVDSIDEAFKMMNKVFNAIKSIAVITYDDIFNAFGAVVTTYTSRVDDFDLDNDRVVSDLCASVIICVAFLVKVKMMTQDKMNAIIDSMYKTCKIAQA